jgi:hypothetical protein
MKTIAIIINMTDDKHNELFELKTSLDGLSPEVAKMSINDFFISCLEKGSSFYQDKLSYHIPDTNRIMPNLESMKKLYPWFTEYKNVQMSFEEFQLYILERTIYNLKNHIQNMDDASDTDSFWEYYLSNRNRFLYENSLPYYKLTYPNGSSYTNE